MNQTSDDTTKRLEVYLREAGGCGKYQILLALTIHSMKSLVNFSMLFFMFGRAIPGWWCLDDVPEANVTLTEDSPQYKNCKIGNTNKTCQTFLFDDSMKTVVSEWHLVCDQEWVPFLVTSLQMAGILVGNVACGQLADLFGRKPPFFLSYIILILSNLAAAFATTWTMAVVFWMIGGIACGFFLTLQYHIMAEYSLIRWRTWLIATPSWEIESMVFALVAWLVKNWRHIHLVSAILGVPLVVAYWFIGMESFRWYVSHDRIDDARGVIKRVARINKAPVPDLTNLETGIEDKDDRKYTLWDLVRTRTLLMYTSLFIFIWINLGLSTYGLQFGVSSLTGNLYINIFAIGLVGCPLRLVSIYLQNRFGRKKAATIFNVISVITAFVVAIEYRFEESELRDKLTNISALVSLIAIHQSWSPIQTLTIELYPTVIRSIGYGFHNTMARIGAVIGPQLVFLDTKFSGSMYWVCAVTTLVAALLILKFPETKNRDLPDKISK